ncbi:hypothetical protein [Acinetobacter sp. YH01009]|uniref:hypothetical protein n=1 Tax=Acinetobacter sp. YH01009 TaxID=2601025 RepID=UPI0015D20180|nr:hypothetical protein [Acinetobacter sp. YH01009]
MNRQKTDSLPINPLLILVYSMGLKKKIYADAAPEFFDKEKFVNWVVKSIN